MKKVIALSIAAFSFVIADEFVESSTTIGGYGELHYDMEQNDSDGKLDFHRWILFVKHTFNDQWSMMSEMEVEHNMVYSSSGADDGGGYVALEQAYLNYWNADKNWGWKGGVILVPAGITNEYHEPPTFMSVERPEYNTYIIPTTWFDNGFAFYGKIGDLIWNFSITGDLNGDGIGEGIRGGRMKGVSSTTTSWTKTAQLSWTGMDGLKVGGSVTMNDAPTSAVEAADGYTEYTWEHDGDGWGTIETVVEAVEAAKAGSIGVQLTEFNATYSKNNIYARVEYGMIDYTNNPSANSSSGYYMDLGYDIADLVDCDDSNLYVWTRSSLYNKNDDGDATDISLLGLTYKPTSNIAIKFETGSKNDEDVMRMGIGYMF